MKNPIDRWLPFACAVLVAGVAAGCSADREETTDSDGTPSGAGGSVPAPTSGTTDPDPDPDGCDPGEVRACEIPVGTANGILTCIAGQEACRDSGAWGPCEGTITSRKSPAGLPDGMTRNELEDPEFIEAWLRELKGSDLNVPRAITDSDSCESPCDPACQAFDDPLTDDQIPGGTQDEVPDGGSFLDFLSDVADGILDFLLGEDCDEKSDCNVDTYCDPDDDDDDDDGDDGECEPWDEDDFDDTAAGCDLTVGAGCGEVGSQLMPVCNRGNAACTDDIELWFLPANSPDIGNCGVSWNVTPEESCTITDDLAPGECMVVPAACWTGITGNNKSVLVNPGRNAKSPPGDLTGYMAQGVDEVGDPFDGADPEESCNNWGFWDKSVACETCTISWEAELDEDDDDGSFCGVYFEMDVDVMPDDRMINLYYKANGPDDWTPITWVWNDEWEDFDYNEHGCSGGNQAFIYEHNYSGDLHYHVRLCDDLCSDAVSDSDPEVKFEYGCLMNYDDSLTNSVVYGGICPPATHVQWGYLGFNGVTPSDTSIVIEGRSGSTDPPTGSFIELADADNDISPACLLDDPDSDCPIDLFDAFDGAPAATREFLEIQYTLNSSGDNRVAPRLYELYTTFTCPDTE